MENKYSQLHHLIKELIQDVICEAIDQKRMTMEQQVEKPKSLLDDTLNADEAAKLLRIAKQTLYTLTSKRKIPFYKNGKKILFSKKDLEAWVIESKHEDESAATNDAQRYLLNHPIKR